MNWKAKITEFAERLTADRRKFGAFLTLVALGLLLWGRLLLHNVPRTATAEPSFVHAALEPDNTAQKPSPAREKPTSAKAAENPKSDLGENDASATKSDANRADE